MLSSSFFQKASVVVNTLRVMICFSLVSVGLYAQGITPPVAEFRSDKAISGMFEIENTADYPIAVTLISKSFVVDEHGLVRYSALSGDVKIRLGANSFILKSHDNRMIFYKASFPTAPTSFSIIATMTRAEPEEGVRVSFVFPHMIYVYQKEKLNKADITVKLRDGILRIHNSSPKLGRIEGVQASKEEMGGFPIYPNQTREVATTATNATVRFQDGFKVEAQ